MFGPSPIALFAIIGLLWLVQLYLAYRQMKRFYRRMRQLRKDGVAAIGMAGTRLRGRAYGVLVVDPETRFIMHSEKMSGWTVFANLKKVHGLVGHPLADLLEGRLKPTNVPDKVYQALLNAGTELQKAFDKSQTDEVSDDDGDDASDSIRLEPAIPTGATP